uniref:uncharacterized protein LOC100179342 n=1 Tax=Ciona intestinalis TaxID=7719 RepID=UPI000180B812|nr:uncharacterized protein LOC100179342 [Ciona intestinalis]|eukprot:XP_002126643.1 uncharacterized protein LOC100179342 [Ciona intestinalis]
MDQDIATPMYKLESLSDHLAQLKRELNAQESLCGDTDLKYTENINSLRELRRQFISQMCSLIFLAEFVKHEQDLVPEEEFTSNIDQLGALSKPEMKLYAAVKIRNKNIMRALDEAEEICSQFQDWQEFHLDIMSRKNELIKVVDVLKVKSDIFMTENINEEKAKVILREQEKKIIRLEDEIANCLHHDVISPFEKITYEEVDALLSLGEIRKHKAHVQSHQDMEMSAVINFGHLQVVDNQSTCKILEVFYEHDDCVRSSVMVRLTYNKQSDNQPSKISVTNCPVEVNDILGLDIQSFLSQLQLRLNQIE